MTLDPDSIVDRRRIRRRLSSWRLLAILAVLAAVFAVAYAASGSDFALLRKDHIAAIDVDGLITGRSKLIKLIRKVGESKSAKALIVRIDSPGGTTAGSEALYEALRKVAEEKPVVAVMENVAASGGYIVALAADHIIARGNSITGSIGVLFQWAQVEEALASLGIEVQEIKSGPLKSEPSLFRETSEQARAVTQEMVRDSYEWFLRLFAERRQLDLARARVLGDGRVYTGRQAVDGRLIDRIGGEDDAKSWLVEEKGLSKDLELVEWNEDDLTDISIGARALSGLARELGLPGWAGVLTAPIAGRRLQLDGLLSLWHPDFYR